MTRDKSGRTSAGILLYRRDPDTVRVLLAHPGGPFWVGRDAGHWTIPKGEADPGEELLDVARREFLEETGSPAPATEPIPLDEIFQKSGKRVVAWAAEGDLDPATAVSNTFEMEWPPGSGRAETFPEIDRVAWFDPEGARAALKAAQIPFVERLLDVLADSG
jgi:predicted NUDIX family NTP pyrophosphohydrolase